MKQQSNQVVSVMIAGVQKAATSSLYSYMRQHPEFTGHEGGEFSFFVMDKEYEEGITKIWRQYFPNVTGHTKFLAKSAGIIFSEVAIKRLKEHNPGIKIILVLRNPVDRAYSAYWYARKNMHEDIGTFEEAVFADPYRYKDPFRQSLVSYIPRGYYASQLKVLFKYFPESSVKIILQEDLRNGLEIMKDLFHFAGTDPRFIPDLAKISNKAARSKFPAFTKFLRGEKSWKKILKTMMPVSTAKDLKRKVVNSLSEEFDIPPMDPQLRIKLTDHFRSHNIELQEMIGRDLGKWM